MAHKIFERDLLLLANTPELHAGKGWHGLGTPHEDFTAEGVKKLLWTHSMAPAGILLPDGAFHATGERYAVASDDGLPIGGAVGKNWFSRTNAELFELFRDALAGSAYSIVSIGTVQNRLEWWVDAKGDQQKTTRRDFSPFVGLHRGFGGTSKTRVGGHSMCMQCANTTAAFVAEIERADSGDNESVQQVKNTTRLSLPATMDALKHGIERAHGVQSEFIAAMRGAESMEISPLQARDAFIGLLAPTKMTQFSEDNSRVVNRTNRLQNLFIAGDGNEGATVADWVSACTDYWTHESSGGEASKQFLSSEFGSGARRKTEIVDEVLMSDESPVEIINGYASRGASIVSASSRDSMRELVATSSRVMVPVLAAMPASVPASVAVDVTPSVSAPVVLTPARKGGKKGRK